MKKKLYRGILPLILTLTLAVSALALKPQRAYAYSDAQIDAMNEIYDFLINEMNYNSAAASGILATIEQTCKYTQYAATGNTYYGLMKWSGTKLTNMKTWCTSNGCDSATIQGQLSYVKYQLTRVDTYQPVHKYMLGVADTPKGAYDAGYYWSLNYQKAKKTVSQTRGNLAKSSIYPIFHADNVPEESQEEESSTEYVEETEPSESDEITFEPEETEPGEETEPAPTKPDDTNAPAGPTLISASNQENGILVTWQSVKNASYRIYRKTGDSNWVQIAASTDPRFLDKDVTLGQLYYYTVRSVVGSTLSKQDEKGIAQKRVDEPSMRSISNAARGVSISWYAAAEASSYGIYRKCGTEGWKRIATVGKSIRTWTDTSAKSGSTYAYAVCAISDQFTSYHDAAGLSTKYVAQPKLISVANNDNGLVVTWEAVGGADSYRIYKIRQGVRTLMYTADASLTSWTDTQAEVGVSSSYTVVACMDESRSSVNTLGMSYTRVPTPVLTSAVNNEKSITIRWSSVSVAGNYLVYRSVNGGIFKLMKTLDSATLSYKDKDVSNGSVYTYRVLARKGTCYSMAEPTPLSITFLSAPTMGSTVNTAAGQKITWTANAKAENYYIYRKLKGTTTWEQIGSVPATQTGFEDTTCDSGKTYWYAVAAGAGGSQGTHSATGIVGIRMVPPKMVSAVNKVDNLRISWEKAPGAVGYVVYRKTATGSWTKIGTTTKTYYDNSGLKNGTAYTYTVSAYGKYEKTLKYSVYGDQTITGLRLTQNKFLSKAQASQTVTLTWSKNGACDGYEVQYDTSLAFESAETFSYPDAGVVTCMLNALTKGKTYYFRIRSYKEKDGVKYYSPWYTSGSMVIK